MFRKFFIAAWIISIGSVLYLSLVPRVEFPIGFQYADFVYHAIAYLWLAFLPFFGFNRTRAAFCGALFMILLGGGLELIQGLIPNRFSSILDMAANILGVALGVALGFYLKSILLKGSSLNSNGSRISTTWRK